MVKPCKKFPPEIKDRWDALAGKGLPSDALQEFEKYLISKEVAKPEQVTAFVALMKQIPADEKEVTAHVFDELYKKFHQSRAGRDTVHSITKSLLEARHGEAMKWLAQNHLGMENPNIPRLVDKAIDDACKEVLVKPKEHVLQTEQTLKTTTRRRLLHVMDVVRLDRKEHALGAVPTILVKEPGVDDGAHGMAPVEKIQPHHVLKHANAPGTPHEVHPIVKKAAHHVLPNGKLLGKPHVNGANHDANGTPVQSELFNEKEDIIAIKAKAANIRPIAFKPRDESSANPNSLPSFRFRISGGRSFYAPDMTGIEQRLANPVPVTEEEKDLAERKRIRAERKAAFKEAGGFIGMLGLGRSKANGANANAAFLNAVQQELFENETPAQAVNGNETLAQASLPDPLRLKHNPIPVTDKERAKVASKLAEEKRRAAYEAGGGFTGMLGRAIRGGGFVTKLAENTQQNIVGGDDMARGK